MTAKDHATATEDAAAAARGRLCVVAAAMLWSLSGFFTRVLKHDTPLRLGPEPVDGLTIAFYRAFFAGVVLLPALRPRDLSWRPLLPVMAVCFAVMNLTFVLALAGGKSSNAILLQYSAPMWIYLAGVRWLGEPASRRGLATMLVGLLGVAVIVVGGWSGGDLTMIGLGLASGFFYAVVLLFLRVLREESPWWLTVLNHLSAAAAVAPLLLYRGWPALTAEQYGLVALFGAVQMGLPYALMARGLRSVGPQEAGVLMLLEPLLNPLWAYLAAPEAERPTVYTFVGGAFIVGALAWRYWPTAPRSGTSA